MYPQIVNTVIISADDIAAPVYQTDTSLGLYSYPILTRLRPPRNDLYIRIITADEEARWRLMYSFVVGFVRSGSPTLLQQQGIMLRLHTLGNEDNFVIIHCSDLLPLSDVHDVTPVPATADEAAFWEAFAAANPTYVTYLQEYSPEYVNAYSFMGLIFVVPPAV